MAGHWCPMVHWLNLKACVGVKNGQLKAIKMALRLSRHLAHVVMFEVGFYFQSLSTTKPIIKEAPIYLGHRHPTLRFICSKDKNTSTDVLRTNLLIQDHTEGTWKQLD